MITDQQFADWLKSQSAIRCVLAEVEVKLAGGGTTTRYLSNQVYVTSAADTPANTSYTSRITGGIKYTRSLSLDGQVSLSFGDIELTNLDGLLDSWVDDYWTNRPVSIYLGDPSWARSDFRMMFAGSTTGIDMRTRTRLNIKISDLLQRLNYPVTEDKLGGATSLADNILPLCFGECHNITPMLVDGTVNEYMVHNGPIERIIEVRDNGVPVAITPFLSTGKFRLVASPAGTITASVQGAKPSSVYLNNIAAIIKHLVVNYGSTVNRFVSGDLDTAAFTAFESANPQQVGIYLDSRQNVLDVCTKLAASVGARLVITSAGKCSLVKLDLPQALPGTAISSSDFVSQSLSVKQLAPVVASVKLGYDKNWTVQDKLTTGIVTEHAALFAEEWLTITRTDSAAATNYNLFTDPVMSETYLLTAANATTEANRRLGMFSVQRKVLTYTGFYHLIQESLGGSQTITHPRFGLSSGKTGQIISISVDFTNPHVDFEVLI